MAAYDLYGVKRGTIFEVRLKVEESLNVFFEERESTYQGGIYYRFGEGELEKFFLKVNVDPFDGEAVELEFSKYPVLMYVDMTTRSEEIRRLLGVEFCLLRHELYD